MTRFFLTLIALGTSLMLLSGALLPTDALPPTDTGATPAGIETLRMGLARVLALFG